jgi:hypothetical protein
MADMGSRALAHRRAGWYATGGEPPPEAQDLPACHAIQRERPQPLPGMATPIPAGLRRPEPRWRPTHGPFPVRHHPEELSRSGPFSPLKVRLRWGR